MPGRDDSGDVLTAICPGAVQAGFAPVNRRVPCQRLAVVVSVSLDSVL